MLTQSKLHQTNPNHQQISSYLESLITVIQSTDLDLGLTLAQNWP